MTAPASRWQRVLQQCTQQLNERWPAHPTADQPSNQSLQAGFLFSGQSHEVVPRRLLLDKCRKVLKPGGVAFLAVFSEQEKSFGKGLEVEPNTFESKPGRPVHYYTEQDLREEMRRFAILECGLATDRENHGEEGEHTHVVRYIAVKKE